MGTSFIDEYLVKLGASVDASGMQRFNQALREATAVSTNSAASIAGAFFKTQAELTAGFAAIGSAAIGLVDKVAMADQSYRLFALHMYMSKDAARGLKVAMDALGEPLENLTWDPELRGRTHQLIKDQLAMAPNGDFEAQMRKVRDIRFEFTRMEVEGQYLAMHVVQDFMKALGVGPDELLLKLQKFNDWIITNMPGISETLVNDFLPIWSDIKDIMKVTSTSIMEALGAYEMLIGTISGDEDLKTGTVNFENLAKAIEKTTHALTIALESMLALENGVITGSEIAYDVMMGVGYSRLNTKEADKWFAKADEADRVGTPTTPGLKGWAMARTWNTATDVHTLIDKYAAEQGVDPALAHAIAMHESSEQQFDKSGKLVRNPDSTATGVFQLLNGTAKTLGVDSTDTKGNIQGGIKYLAMLLKYYHGDLPEAIGGFQIGQGAMDKVLAGRATLSPKGESNIGDILRLMGQHGDVHVGTITIHIDKPGATNADVGNAVVKRLQDMQDKRIQRNLSEFQDQSYAY